MSQKPSMSLSTANLQSSIPLQKNLPCPLQLIGAWSIDFHTAVSDNSIDFECPPTSGVSTCHRPQHALKCQYWPQTPKGLWQQPSPWISAWLQAAAQTTDILHGFWYNININLAPTSVGPVSSAWPLAKAQAAHIFVAFGGIMAHGHHQAAVQAIHIR